MNLEEFLESSHRNYWIAEGDYSIYVRKARHYLASEKLVYCLDIASIENRREKGTGGFWKLIEEAGCIASKAKIQAIYIENVLNYRLSKSLPEHGFLMVSPSSAPCFYKNL